MIGENILGLRPYAGILENGKHEHHGHIITINQKLKRFEAEDITSVT